MTFLGYPCLDHSALGIEENRWKWHEMDAIGRLIQDGPDHDARHHREVEQRHAYAGPPLHAPPELDGARGRQRLARVAPLDAQLLWALPGHSSHCGGMPGHRAKRAAVSSSTRQTQQTCTREM